jgi:hypothetical protein
VLTGHKQDIVSLIIPDPYAMLMSMSNDGSIIVWGLRQFLSFKYLPIKKLQYSHNITTTNISVGIYYLNAGMNLITLGDEKGNI